MNHLKLCETIDREIQDSPQKKISFADYMNLVLYHPKYGYYTTGAGKIGAGGDFATSPHLCPDFGEMLAEQFVQMWQILECQEPFQVVEMGAGQGLIAGDVLAYLQKKYPDFFSKLKYIIIEKSPAMRQFQQQRLAKFVGIIRWCSLSEIEANSIIGCCFSNELVDALPVHQFVIDRGELKEIYVTTSSQAKSEQLVLNPNPPFTGELNDRPNHPLEGRLKNPGDTNVEFVEVLGELSTPRIAEYFDWLELDLLGENYPNAYRSEVNLAALDWLTEVAERLKCGYLLTIDYGYPSHRYYSPSRHQGTLQCYYQHRYHDNPYVYVGRQDITAHINFTALERHGHECGLENIGFTQQGLFLMSLGLGDRIAAISTTPGLDIMTALQRREVLHKLIDPMALGNFGVLAQSKGLSDRQLNSKLTGFTIPPMI